MGIVLGLGAALAFGAGDFCARFASREIGNFRTLLYMQVLGLVGLSLWLGLVEQPQILDWPLVGLAALLAIGNTVGGLALYRAFEVGVLSVVSPIAASYGAITLLLGLASGQKPSLWQILGLIITIVGVILASTTLSGLTSTFRASRDKIALKNSSLLMAIGASLCFGVVFWGLGYVTPQLGGVLPTWEIRLVGPLLVLALARPLSFSIRLPKGRVWYLIAAVGLFDTLAFLFLNYGLRLADSGIVSVISSLFSAFTILLARLFLNEKLAPNQWVGVALILLGVASISTG